MGLREPPATAPAVGPRDIDVWLVPGVAFTTTGERLGRGGGYYDATLSCARSDAPLVGLSFECCVIGGWPAEAHDVKVKWLITERAASRCEPLTPFISG